MAQQVNLGTVRVTNGSTTVRHEWKLLMTSDTGTFVVGSTVLWSGGTGLVGFWDPATKELRISRSSGPNPAAGTVISQTVPSVASATVSSVAPGSPPNWNTRLSLPAVATFERHYASYEVQSLAADSFVLTTNYLGDTAPNIEYGLNTDFTTLGLGLIRPGDVGAVNIVSRSMMRVTNLLTRGSVTLGRTSNQALAHGNNFLLQWQQAYEADTGGFYGSLPVDTLVVPAGVRRIDVNGSISLVSAMSNALQLITLKLIIGANVWTWDALAAPGQGRTVSQYGVLVTPGDPIALQIGVADPATAGVPSILVHQSTHLRVRVAEVI